MIRLATPSPTLIEAEIAEVTGNRGPTGRSPGSGGAAVPAARRTDRTMSARARLTRDLGTRGRRRDLMFLTDDELTDLTGMKRRDGRVRALREMGVEHRIRPDGRVIVLRAHVESLLGGAPGPIVSGPDPEPDWSALASPKKA